MRLHEVEAGAAEASGNLADIAAQYRRQIGIGDGGVSARHQSQQRARLVAQRYLGEAGLAGQHAQLQFQFRIFPGVDQGDGDGIEAILARLLQNPGDLRLGQLLHKAAVHCDAAGNLGYPLVQHAWKLDVEIK
jgi:hypothetical protein